MQNVVGKIVAGLFGAIAVAMPAVAATTAQLPEPGTWALAGLAIVAAVALGRRNRK